MLKIRQKTQFYRYTCLEINFSSWQFYMSSCRVGQCLAVFPMYHYLCKLFLEHPPQLQVSTSTPMSLIWTISSIIGSWIMLRMSFRSVAIIGSVFLTAGCFFLTTIDVQSKQLFVMIYTSLMGVGMV